MDLKKEFVLLSRAIKETKTKRPSRKRITFELVTNGVAWAVSLFISMLLHQFFEVRSIKNLWGLARSKDKILLDKGTFSIFNWIVIFIVGLFIFTLVEGIMERYLTLRQSDTNDNAES